MSDSVIHRWSKRKRTEQDSAADKPEPGDLEKRASQELEDSGAEPEQKEQVELPDIESLDHESDYSAFLSPEVDEALRKVALRKLFKAPFFNQLDGLNDYDEDFTTFEALGDIVTSDMKFHQERKKAEAEAAAKAEAEAQQEQPPTLAEEDQDEAVPERADAQPELAAADESDDEDQTAIG